MSNLVRLMTSNLIRINRIASILEHNNISSLLKDNNESATLAGFGSSQNDVDLFVKESDLEQATQAIKDFEKKD